MTITLRITNDAARVNGAEPQKVFDEQGGTIGRALGSYWVLPDPRRCLSSHHAAIYFKDGAWYLADTSANGVYVNGASQPVGSEAPVRLNDSDRLQMAEYEIEVRIEALANIASPPAPADCATPSPQTDFQPGAPIPETLDPLELLGARAATHLALETPSHSQEPIPDSDVVGPIGPGEMGPIGPVEMGPIGPVEMGPMGPSSEPFLKDISASASAGSHPDDVVVLESGFRPPDASPEQIPEDWDPLTSPPLPPGPLQPAPIPESPAARPPESSPSPEAAATASDAMLRAFFEGTGLDPVECLAKADPELPRLVGKMFREMVAGMHAVLGARAHLKSGFRMDVTMIHQRENNPLKFAAGGTDEAMRHLLFHSGSSYQSPLEAVREGFDDLKKHQVAVMAGMKAALLSVLQRFDPEKLASEFEPRAKTGLVLRNKRAKYWELYAEFYQELLTEVEDDFHDTVGRSFAKSYEEQLDRLSKAGKNYKDRE